MLYFGRIGGSWGHRAFFGSSWKEKVITPKENEVWNRDYCWSDFKKTSS
jgi:hypothetical protein